MHGSFFIPAWLFEDISVWTLISLFSPWELSSISLQMCVQLCFLSLFFHSRNSLRGCWISWVISASCRAPPFLSCSSFLCSVALGSGRIPQLNFQLTDLLFNHVHASLLPFYWFFFIIGSSGFTIAIFSYHSEDTDWSTLKMCYSLLFQPFAPVFIPLVVRFMPLSCSVSFLKHWWLLIVSLPLCLRISGGVMLPGWMCQFPIILLVHVTCTEYEPEGDHQWSHFKVPFSAA